MAWPSKPATLSTGIRHGPAVRAPGDSGSRQGGHAGQADRLLAPGFAPLLLPGRTVSVLLATGRDPQHRAELRELPCRKPPPEGVYLPALQEVRSHFSRPKYAADLQKRVELRGFEPLTSCMPCLTVPSSGVPLGRVTARQGNGLVWWGLAASAVVWERCHLVCHWQPACFRARWGFGVVDTERVVVPLQAYLPAFDEPEYRGDALA